jgi:hypothetical protein
MSTMFRSRKPRTRTYPKYPKISPEAPTVTALPDWNSHTAMPLVTSTMSETTRKRAIDR